VLVGESLTSLAELQACLKDKIYVLSFTDLISAGSHDGREGSGATRSRYHVCQRSVAFGFYPNVAYLATSDDGQTRIGSILPPMAL